MEPLELVADCSRCAGLCCVLLPFRAVDGFGVDKDGGTPCHHLAQNDRCSIHATLRADGWPGCTVFDCFGAGQHLTQETYAGRSWRAGEARLGEMAAVLSVMRVLHEAVRHLREAALRTSMTPDAAAEAAEAAEASLRVEGLTRGTPAELLDLDLDLVMGEVAGVLREASAAVREAAGADLSMADLSRTDLAGADLRNRDLRAADLHGALLIASDLRGVDLTDADLLGADLRDADVRGARLADALFLTQPQVNAMRGDATTLLPPALTRPGHWD